MADNGAVTRDSVPDWFTWSNKEHLTKCFFYNTEFFSMNDSFSSQYLILVLSITPTGNYEVVGIHYVMISLCLCSDQSEPSLKLPTKATALLARRMDSEKTWRLVK